MTKIKFTGATAIASNHEALTVGAVGLGVQFEFNSAWDGLNKIAVFHCGGVTKDVLDSSFPANICPIPWECLQEEGETLYCGVYGTDSNGKVIIPSKMARLGTVHPGADPTGDESLDPTLPVWQQALNIAQEAMSKLAGKVNRSGDTMQGDLDMGFHTLRLGSTTGMTEDNLNIIRLVADREEDRVILRNVDTPFEDSDAVNKKYVDDTVGALNTDDIHISASSEHHSANDTVTEVLDGLSKAIMDKPGIQSVEQTATSTEDGGTNIITVTKTDGTSSTFTVRNGSKGSTGATGAAGRDGYTPVRGTDYWTADDIAAIQSYIDDKINTELAGINTLLGSGIQISFTIDGETFSAVSGETWKEWVGTSRVISEISGLTLYCYSDDGIIFADEAGVNALGLNDVWVHGNETIVPGATYAIIPCGG